MTSLTFPSYKDRDRIFILEKQIEDLKLLTTQQSLTIKKLQEESSAKSDKISELMGVDNKSRSFHGNMTMTRQIRTISSSNFHPRPIVKSSLDPKTIQESKLQQLSNEVQFWKRQFNNAESRITDLSKEKSNLKSKPLQTVSENNLKDTESLYLKKLLDENLDLKLKIEKLNSQLTKSKIGHDDSDVDDHESEKENEPLQSEVKNKPSSEKSSKGLQPVTLRSKSAKNLKSSQFRPKSAQPNNNVRATSDRSKNHVPGHSGFSRPRSLDSVATSANKRAGSANTNNVKSKNGQSAKQSTEGQIVGQDCDVCDHQKSYQHQASEQQHYHPYYHSNVPQDNHLQQQVHHLTHENQCLQHQICKLKADLEMYANVYVCACQKGAGVRKECIKVQCLQRQVCHLKHQLHLQNHCQASKGQQSSSEIRSVRFKLDDAETEIKKLEEKCDHLLEQKKMHLDKISNLQKQLDSLLSSSNIDSRVKGLINNIESQRDNYKHQVEKLIKDLQSEDKIVYIERDRTKETSEDNVDVGGRVKKTILSQPRSNQKRNDSEPTRSDARDPEPSRGNEDLTLSLELLQVRTKLAETTSQLEHARREISSLRSRVEDYRSQLQRQNVKQTQTSPIVEKRHPGVEEAVNELKNRIILLERENIKLREAKLELERKNKRYDSIDVVDVGRDKSDINDKELRDKVRFLENQLEKTEDSLRNCQNLMSDNSKRTLDLNSQIVTKARRNCRKKIS